MQYIKNEVKSETLRISKSSEQKPEIKKVRKQETEKEEYIVKDYVVYPKHGVGKIIIANKKNKYWEIKAETHVLKFEKDKTIWDGTSKQTTTLFKAISHN